MELRQLRYFAATAHTGTVSQAARECGVTQSALSQQIHKLEAELGVELFGRRGKRVYINAAGERLLPWADRALIAADHGSSYASLASSAPRPAVHLGGLASLDSMLVPQALSQFSRLHPDIDVSVLENDGRTDFEAMLIASELDLAIGRLPVPASSLDARPLVSEPIVLVGPPGHRLHGRGPAPFGDLRDEAFVAATQGSSLRELLMQLCGEAGFAPHISVETNRFETVREMVLAGQGFAVLPHMAVGMLPWRRIDSPHAQRKLYLLSRRRASLPHAVRTLAAFLEAFTAPHRSGA